MAGSESVFNIIQFGAQSGTAYAPGSAIPATVLVPVESPVPFDLDRSSTFPKQDRGRNVRNSAGQGFHGIRAAGCTLPMLASYEYLPDLLEMHASGGVTPTGTYTRVYPLEGGTPTLVPRTIEGGNTDATQTQQRLTSCLIDTLTMGFPDIVAPGAYPWTISATILGFDRTMYPLTAALPARTGMEILQGVQTTLLEGPTATAFASLAELAGSLKSFTMTTNRHLARRAYGAAVTRVISSNTLASPTVVTTSAPHLLTSGQVVAISGSNSTPVIDGAQVVTVLSGTTFSVPVNVTTAGTAGTVLCPSDLPTRYGFKDMSDGTCEAKIAVSATSLSNFHDIWNATSLTPLGERRWRVKCIGSGAKAVIIDARVAIMAVPTDEVDGERIFKVSGEFVDDATLTAPVAWSITNSIATL